MRIDQLIRHAQPSLSCEITPSSSGPARAEQTAEELARIRPRFLSITYGPPGPLRTSSIALAEWIENRTSVAALAHLACVGHDQNELAEILERLWASGIRNLLALRGEAPTSISQWTAADGAFPYASELVAFIRRRRSLDFCIGVAGYPEGHPETGGRDLDGLKRKLDAGGNFVLTEYFFDNAGFYRFRDRARSAGINAPIIATLMPILHLHQARQVVSARRVGIAPELLSRIEAAAGKSRSDPQAVHKVGVGHALSQAQDLLANGAAEGLHFYTLNNSRAAAEIFQAIRRAGNSGAG